MLTSARCFPLFGKRRRLPLAGFRNRASVFLSWRLTFLSRSQAAGLITEEPTGSNVDRH
jgi:hypothetical protein